MIRVLLEKAKGKKSVGNHCAIEFAEVENHELPIFFQCIPLSCVTDEVARGIAEELTKGTHAGALKGYRWRVEPNGNSPG